MIELIFCYFLMGMVLGIVLLLIGKIPHALDLITTILFWAIWLALIAYWFVRAFFTKVVFKKLRA